MSWLECADDWRSWFPDNLRITDYFFRWICHSNFSEPSDFLSPSRMLHDRQPRMTKSGPELSVVRGALDAGFPFSDAAVFARVIACAAPNFTPRHSSLNPTRAMNMVAANASPRALTSANGDIACRSRGANNGVRFVPHLLQRLRLVGVACPAFWADTLKLRHANIVS